MNMDLGSWSTRVAAAVRAEMTSQHLDVMALARVLGVTEPTVAARLGGEIPFDLVELERVADWLGLAPSELVARADQPAA
jgi:hypothetical protein